MAKQNKSLGKFRLTGIKRAMRGVPQIEVTFTIDANGIVKVAAKDLGTGKSQDIVITASSNMSDAEIQEAIRNAQENAAGDEQQRRDMDLRNKAEALLYRGMESMKKCPKEEKSALKSAVKDVQKALRSKDGANLAPAVQELERMLGRVGG